MTNSYENLPEEYENDGNTYCHGVVNCKYFYDGDCDFYSMGSGNPDDMPCLVQASADVKAFREWREQKEKGGMTCNNKCIHYPVCEQKKWDFANINECEYYADKDKPKGEFTDLERKVIADSINYLLGAELLKENGYTETVINALKSVLQKIGAEENHL